MSEGSTNKYSPSTAAVEISNPFSVSLVERTSGNSAEGGGDILTNECGFSFVQAFVVSYGKQQQEGAEEDDPTNENERMVPIENMDKVFKMDYSAGSTPIRRIYEVKIELDDDQNPKKATLQKKPLDGEDGYRSDPTADTLEQDGILFIPVCETINESVTKIWLRDNIHLGGLGGGGGGGCVPWTPKVINKGTAEAPKYEITLNAGTINGNISAGWNKPIPMLNPIGTYYVVATVSLTDGQIKSIDYFLEPQVPTGDELNPKGVNTLPTSIKIILATVIGYSIEGSAPIIKSCAVWSSSLYLESVDIYHDPKENVQAGEAPYDIWYAYKISSL